MDYEKKYNEALERFKSFKEKYYTKDTDFGDVIFDKTGKMQKDFESIFPELRESKDEGIRKKCIELIKRAIPNGDSQSQESKEILDCIAYLEKQKPTLSGEDERIRKEIIEVLRFVPSSMWEQAKTNYERCFAYLEKQKEPTTEELYAEAGTTEKEYIANTMKMVRAMREKKQEQKPAEWSEEDEKQLDDIISIIRGAYEHGITISETRHRNAYSWLNNLRPSWKPSERQLTKLYCIAEGISDDDDAKVLKELYEQLKKL